MQVKVVSNEDISFAFFLRTILKMKDWPWTKRGITEEIPEDLIEEAHKYSNIVDDLTYEKHPREELEDRDEGLESVLKRSEKLHRKLWNENQERIQILTETLEKIKPYLKSSLGLIENSTGMDWPCKALDAVVCLYRGGSAEGNKVFMGIDYSKERLEDLERELRVLIHEAIHINTNPKFRQLSSEEGLRTDANEIYTVLLTSQISRKINRKHGLSIEKQEFNQNFRKKIGDRRSDLEEIFREHSGYEKTVKAIDSFLDEIDYQTAYN